MKKSKKRLLILVIIGILMVLTSIIIGLYWTCMHTNHTKEVCPITKILNVIYYINPQSKLLSKHQIKSMIATYQEENISYESIKYGEIIEPVYNTYTTEALISCDEKGNLYYEAPSGYVLLPDGTCERKVKIGEQFRGLYGITTYFLDGTSENLVTLDFSK